VSNDVIVYDMSVLHTLYLVIDVRSY